MRVEVTTTCIATVQEEWVIDGPDDIEPEDMWDLFNEGDERMKFVAVRNLTVDDERDREVSETKVLDVTPGVFQ